MKKGFFISIVFIIFISFIASAVHSAAPLTVTKHAVLKGDKTETDIPLTGTTDHIYAISGKLDISNNISGNQTGVIFVDGNLTINPSNNKLTHGSATSGLVFVVKEDVYIDTSVTQVDAVIIAEGTIYTAASPGHSCATSAVTASTLTINGSLISLNPDKPIKFCRKLSDNSQPAEVINHQVKYLVILRDLLSDTYQKWSEIYVTAPTTTPAPSGNLLTNGGFENQLTGWTCQGATVSGTCTADTEFIYVGGLYSGKVSNIGRGWGRQLTQGGITAAADEQFCLSAQVKKEAATNDVKIAIQETASPWRQIDLSASATSNWQLVRGTVTRPANWGTPTIQLFLRQSTVASAWFDNVSLTRGGCQ